MSGWVGGWWVSEWVGGWVGEWVGGWVCGWLSECVRESERGRACAREWVGECLLACLIYWLIDRFIDWYFILTNRRSGHTAHKTTRSIARHRFPVAGAHAWCLQLSVSHCAQLPTPSAIIRLAACNIARAQCVLCEHEPFPTPQGTCKGSVGFFPASYVQVGNQYRSILVSGDGPTLPSLAPNPNPKPAPTQTLGLREGRVSPSPETWIDPEILAPFSNFAVHYATSICHSDWSFHLQVQKGSFSQPF